ncbi:hypothetical protein JX266_002272 [Neoarthrinium moseri]|nr:hypothetical protein JX266_002272 [Neoarthrinium moseri]
MATVEPTLLYTQLQSTSLQIRLLKVRSGDVESGETQIVCDMDTVTFNHSLPKYTALSYTWGEAEPSITITVNGVRRGISSNLAAFLQQWIDCRRNSSRIIYVNGYLWIDALCINQEDEEEKSVQVSAMGRIFSSANATIAWLGVEAETSAIGLRYIREMARAIKATWSKGTVDFYRDLGTWFNRNPTLAEAIATLGTTQEPKFLLNNEIWDGILRIFQRDYWTRSWIQQEIVLSQVVYIWCGPNWAPMDDVRELERFLTDLRVEFGAKLDRDLNLSLWQDIIGEWRHPLVRDMLKRITHFTRLGTSIKQESSTDDLRFGLLHILEQACGSFKATDPRDKLYSLLGVVNLDFPPDYTQSTEHVYTDIAGPAAVNGPTGIHHLLLPSWVINWDALSCQTRPNSRAALFAKSRMAYINPFGFQPRFEDNMLCISGVVVSSVSSSSRTCNDILALMSDIMHGFATCRPSKSPVTDLIRAVCLDVEPGKQGIGLETQLLTCDGGFDVFDRFVHALCRRFGLSMRRLLDCFDQHPESVHRLYSALGFGSIFRWPQEPVNSVTVESYLTSFQRHKPDIYYRRSDEELDSNFENLSFFTTEEGYAGWGPPALLKDDKLCIFPGCRVPLLLRKVDDHFSLVGQAWVHGIMYGQYYKDLDEISHRIQEFNLLLAAGHSNRRQMSSFDSFVEPWRQKLTSQTRAGEFPEYHSRSQLDSLISSSSPQSFELGTGASIYTNSLLPAILTAQREVILVTCFWAPSSTLTALKETVDRLAQQRKQVILENGPDALEVLRIRICFSSRSLFQKLFHTSSKDGYAYPPSAWPTKLGLPDKETLDAGAIDLGVKSLFFLPFSVMHPKFLIIDRERAWLPSCNVSWEAWLEGCVEIQGNAVDNLLAFYQRVWEPSLDTSRLIGARQDRVPLSVSAVGLNSILSPARRFSRMANEETPTILLPSSHHRNPWAFHPMLPCTPLNVATLRLLELAEKSVYIQTPNLTTSAVLDGIIEALERGVDVTIVTSKNMMLLEQIVTALTTTALCLRSLIRRYTRLAKSRSQQMATRQSRSAASSEPVIDLEAAFPKTGALKVSYFQPNAENKSRGVLEEPVHSHLKLTIVDSRLTLLGSGNMDRASFYTSQELGILFHSSEFTRTVSVAVADTLVGRTRVLFDSHNA